MLKARAISQARAFVTALGLGLAMGMAALLAPATATAQMKEGHAPIPGARIWYQDSGGNGVPVVFLHAGSGSMRMWEKQWQPFTAAGFRMIAYDRRNVGRTELDPAGPQPGTGADDLVALMDHLGIDRFHVVGTAAGGIVTLDAALAHAKRIRSIVVANTTGGVQDPEYLAMTRRTRPSPQFASLPVEFREIGPSYRAGNPEGTARWLELEHMTRPPADMRGKPPTFRNRLTFALLEKITVPTFLITGDADLYTPPSVLRMFSARIKHAESMVFPEVGHSAYWEQPEMFNKAVIEFLRKH
jgi:pimeloyl-ACP methyl ester carboxylesterase